MASVISNHPVIAVQHGITEYKPRQGVGQSDPALHVNIAAQIESSVRLRDVILQDERSDN